MGKEWRRVTAPIQRTEFPSLSEVSGPVKIGAGERDALRQGIKVLNSPHGARYSPQCASTLFLVSSSKTTVTGFSFHSQG